MSMKENVGETGCLEPAFRQNTNDDDRRDSFSTQGYPQVNLEVSMGSAKLQRQLKSIREAIGKSGSTRRIGQV